MDNQKFLENVQRALRYISTRSEQVNAMLNLQVLDANADGEFPKVTFSYESQNRFCNQYGGVHGGIVATIMDLACGTTAASYANRMALTTTDLSVSYLRALTGLSFRIEADVTHTGGHVLNTMCRIYDMDTGKVCASGMATYYVLDSRPLDELPEEE